MSCTTHHHACECRERQHAEALRLLTLYTQWHRLTLAEVDALERDAREFVVRVADAKAKP